MKAKTKIEYEFDIFFDEHNRPTCASNGESCVFLCDKSHCNCFAYNGDMGSCYVQLEVDENGSFVPHDKCVFWGKGRK